MLPLLSDENFNGDVVHGLRSGIASLDLQRVQDVGLSGAGDPDVLEWAAAHRRVILTHDRNTFPGFAFDRVAAGRPMPGVIVISDHIPIGQALDELVLMIHCYDPPDCDQRVLYVPL